MKKCNNCNIKYNTSESVCPLCQNKLFGNECDKVFPSNIRLKTNVVILKCLLFISLVIFIILGFIELYMTNRLHYSLFVMGGLLTNYILIYYILKYKENFLGLFLKYGLILIGVCLLWYFVTKNVIITNYLIPSICIFELVFNVISFIVLKSNYLVNYLNLILLNLFLVLLPVVLLLLKCTTFNLISYICFVFALIVLLGLIIFYFDEIKMELIKIFNI